MNFNINDFFKFFWSIYKVALILFLSGISLILSNNEIKGYVEKGYVGRTPHYYINSFIWDVLQDKWQEIFMKKNLWKITNE